LLTIKKNIKKKRGKVDTAVRKLSESIISAVRLKRKISKQNKDIKHTQHKMHKRNSSVIKRECKWQQRQIDFESKKTISSTNDGFLKEIESVNAAKMHRLSARESTRKLEKATDKAEIKMLTAALRLRRREKVRNDVTQDLDELKGKHDTMLARLSRDLGRMGFRQNEI
jgi:hypothetical protein